MPLFPGSSDLEIELDQSWSGIWLTASWAQQGESDAAISAMHNNRTTMERRRDELLSDVA